MANNPETFEAISQNNITLFHGTNGNALPSILKYGLKSGKELENEGIPVTTGEAWSRRGSQRSFISFTDFLGTAVSYASMPPSQNSIENLSFGVLVGLSSTATSELRTFSVVSELVELGFQDNIPLEYLQVLVVPKDKVEFVNKLIDRNKIKVLSLDLDENFYFKDSLSDFDFSMSQAYKFSGTSQTFSSESLQKLSSNNRKLPDIYKMFGKIQKVFKEFFTGKGEKNEQNFRNE